VPTLARRIADRWWARFALPTLRTMDCLASLAMMTREMSAPLPFSPCGRRWIAGAKASARRMRGMSPRESSVSAERTPHPALRATFSHKGRRESESFVPHGEERVARLEPCRPQTGLHPSRRARCALLRMRSGMCDVLCDCPTGKSLKTCPALARKIFRFTFAPNHSYNSRHPALEKRGVSRSSRTLGAGSGGRGTPGAQEVFAG
jgi:hypothetical protein